jgi:amino acid transporter
VLVFSLLLSPPRLFFHTAIAWVEEAFGGPASLLCGYFHYVSGATDNAIYPSLFLKYLTDRNFAASTRFLICSVITIVLSIVNFLGLEIVGNLSVAVCIFSMSPFAILCIMAVPQIHVSRWMQRPVGPIKWRGLLNNLFWNFNSFDVGANFAGEVKDPATVFPRAMFMSVLMVVSAYLFSLCAALGAVDTVQSDWNAGYFTDLSTAIGGPWLGIWMVVAAAISNIALFEAELSGDSFQLMGMAERGLIPKVFAKRSRFQTPTNGIITGVIVILAVSLADFEQLVAMLNFAYSLALIMQFAAFVQLRISQPDGTYPLPLYMSFPTSDHENMNICAPGSADRPYRVPLSTLGCALFVTPPTCFLAYILCTASRLTYYYFAALSAFGLAFHLFQKTAKHYHLIEYVQAPARIRKIATKLNLDKKG